MMNVLMGWWRTTPITTHPSRRPEKWKTLSKQCLSSTSPKSFRDGICVQLSKLYGRKTKRLERSRLGPFLDAACCTHLRNIIDWTWHLAKPLVRTIGSRHFLLVYAVFTRPLSPHFSSGRWFQQLLSSDLFIVETSTDSKEIRNLFILLRRVD